MRAQRIAILLIVMSATSVAAHHSVLGFDNTRSVTLAGRVAELAWRYPHVYVALDADGAPGGEARWLIELEAPAVLERIGWERQAVGPGDRVSAVGAPAHDGTRRLRCDSVETAGGRRLPCYPPGRTAHVEKWGRESFMVDTPEHKGHSAERVRHK